MFLRVGIYQIQPNFRFSTDYLGKCPAILYAFPTSQAVSLICVLCVYGDKLVILPRSPLVASP